jgi:hypothetical protein
MLVVAQAFRAEKPSPELSLWVSLVVRLRAYMAEVFAWSLNWLMMSSAVLPR